MDDNWHGGLYELAIEIGDTDDDRLDGALRAVWAAAGVRGRYARRDLEPVDQATVPSSLTELTAHGHLLGHVSLPSGIEVVCGIDAIREDDGADWLDFYLLLGALGRADPRVGGFSFGSDGGVSSLPWRRPIDEWLALIGRLVYDQVDCRLALIGFETSGQVYAAQLAESAALPSGLAYLIPDGGNVRYVPADR